ncbi:MAG: hypothetical protein AVDCRST_MAG88-2545, partial [uncultured Thermomicrobiales bacterium]
GRRPGPDREQTPHARRPSPVALHPLLASELRPPQPVGSPGIPRV